MNKKPIDIEISSDYITLGQFLKFADVIQSGGEAKEYLAGHKVVIDGLEDNRRGRKLRGGELVLIEDAIYHLVRK